MMTGFSNSIAASTPRLAWISWVTTSRRPPGWPSWMVQKFDTKFLADINAINGAVKDGKTMDEAVADWTSAHSDLLTRWENNKSYD